MYTPVDMIPGHALPAVLPDTALAFAFADAKIVIRKSEPMAIPTLGELVAAGVDGVRHYLGDYGGIPCIAVGLADDFKPGDGFDLVGLRSVFFRIPEPLVSIAGRAFQVLEWDRTHRFCGRCGTPTNMRADERAKECPACGYVVYPRVSPAMMALVTRDREILLARAHRFPPAMFSALAGFVEAGETIEDCIRREVKEEVGVDVDGLEYFSSQSWPFPHSLMIAFTARYAGGTLAPNPTEIEEARWFHVDALPNLPPSLSIARRLINATAQKLRDA
jgi:NAD+ diphosphatase